MFKKATPQLLFKTREHKYNYWADDLSYAGTINSTAIFWLDEPDGEASYVVATDADNIAGTDAGTDASTDADDILNEDKA
jgi:hypothetical protein